METAIVSLICIALIVFGGMTMSQGFISSVDTSTGGLEELGNHAQAAMRTELTPLNAASDNSGYLDVTLRNSGQIKLANFSQWDVIVQYHDDVGGYQVMWLPYTGGALGDNEWMKQGIYQDAASETPEGFDPGILNPGEEIIIRAKLNPMVEVDTTNMVVISTPNGIPASTYFSRN